MASTPIRIVTAAEVNIPRINLVPKNGMGQAAESAKTEAGVDAMVPKSMDFELHPDSKEMWDDVESLDSDNPIYAAMQLGHRAGGEVGERVMMAMEIMSILRFTDHMKFNNGTRARQHVLIVGMPGIGKSFFGDTFYEKCLGAVGIFNRGVTATLKSGGDPKKPRDYRIVKPVLDAPLLINQSNSMTFAKMRGGATTDGRIIKPVIIEADFVNMTELNAVFGEPPRQDISLMRAVGNLLEEGRMEVAFQKMDEMDDETAIQFWLESRNIPNFTFSLEPRGYTFTTPASFSMATTELTDAARASMWNSGFLSRVDLVEISMTPAEEIEFMRKFGMLSAPDYAPLRRINEDMWRTRFCVPPYPPSHLLGNGAQKWLMNQIEEIYEQTAAQPFSMVNLRDIGNLARVMLAHAISRTFANRRRGDTADVTNISYNYLDARFAIWYYSYYLDQRRMSVETKDPKWNSVESPAHDLMKAVLVKTRDEKNGGILPSVIMVKDFIEAGKKSGKTEKTLRNYLSKLSKAKAIKRARASDKINVDNNYATAKLQVSSTPEAVKRLEDEALAAKQDELERNGGDASHYDDEEGDS